MRNWRKNWTLFGLRIFSISVANKLTSIAIIYLHIKGILLFISCVFLAFCKISWIYYLYHVFNSTRITELRVRLNSMCTQQTFQSDLFVTLSSKNSKCKSPIFSFRSNFVTRFKDCLLFYIWFKRVNFDKNYHNVVRSRYKSLNYKKFSLNVALEQHLFNIITFFSLC